MLTAFAIGAIGTLVGVATAYWITGAHEWLGDKSAAVGGSTLQLTSAVPST